MMDDKWELICTDFAGEQLFNFPVDEAQVSVDGSISVHCIRPTVQKGGFAYKLELRNNGQLVACDSTTYSGKLLGAGYTYQFFKTTFTASDRVYSTRRCTCGGWAVYGRDADIHSNDISNTCELRMP
jgi:hypothetical protein